MRSQTDGRIYTVKLIKLRKAEKNGMTLDSLRGEAARLAGLEHPNIVRYFTSYTTTKNKEFAIVMEHLAGGDLKNRLPMTLTDILKL